MTKSTTPLASMRSFIIAGWTSNALVRNVLSNYLRFGVQALVTLLLTPFLIRRLGAEAYGVFLLLTTLLAYFQLLELGITPSVIRFVSLHKSRGEQREIESVLGSAVSAMLSMALITIPVCWLLSFVVPRMLVDAPLAGSELKTAIWLVGLCAALAYFKRVFFAAIQGYQRFDLLNVGALSGAILGAIGTVTVVLAGGRLIAVLWVLCGQTLYETLVELWILRRWFGLRVSPHLASRTIMRQVLGYSLFALLIDLSVTVAHQIDAVVIAMYLPVIAITHYGVATRLAGFLEKLIDPLMDTFFPLASHLHTRNDRPGLSRLLVEGTRGTLLVVAAPLAVLLWHGADLLRWWVGPEFVEPSLPVLRVFLGIIFVAIFESTASRVLLGVGQVRFDAAVSLATAGANLGLSLALVRPYGIVGVALGTLIPAAIANLAISVPYTCRLTGTPVARFYGSVLLPVAAVVVPSLAFAWVISAFLTDRALAFGLDTLFAAGVGLLVFWRVVGLGALRRPTAGAGAG